MPMDFHGKSYSKGRAFQFLLKAKSTWSDVFLKHKLKVYGNPNRRKVVQLLQQSRPRVSADDEVVGKNVMRLATRAIFTQMLAKKGFKTVGEAAVAAMFKELKQLDEGPMPDKPVVQPVDVDTLSQKVKEQAMEAVNLIKIKRCGRVKGRTCANGSKQRK